MSAGIGPIPPSRSNAVPLVPAHVPRLRFSPHDRITIGGVAYTGAQAVPGGHIFHRVDLPAIAEEFSDDRIWLVSRHRSFELDPDFFAPETARARLAVGAGGLDDLPLKEAPDVIWRWEFCCRFIRAYGSGRATRSDMDMERAIASIYEEMRALDYASVPAMGKNKRRTTGTSAAKPPSKGRKAYAGTKVTVQLRTPPGVRTLYRWLRLLKERGHSPVSLRDGRYRSGCRTPRITGEALRLLVHHGRRYATMERPKINDLHRDLGADIRSFNAGRPTEEHIACPSKTTLGLYIAGLGKFSVYAGRYGLDRARQKFAVITSGVVVTRPFERLEIDSCTVDLQSLLTLVGFWDRLNGKVRREIKRMHFCAAIDVASKNMVGAKLSETPDTATAIAVLRMAVTDKRAYADAAGATLPWDQHASLESVNADGGPQFNNSVFVGCVAALGTSPDFPSGGVPSLRGTIESFFRTVGMQLVARLPGKTFSNVVEKDDYPSEALACIDTPELARLLTRWIVDAYHGTPHDGLAGETPHDAWIRLTRLYGLRKAPDRHKVRSIFGIPLTRTLGNGGIRVLNLRYWCEPLRQHFLNRGNVDLEVKLDPEDIGEVAVRIDGVWHRASCVRDGFEDVAAETWIRAARQIARTHAKGAEATRSAVDAAIRDAGILTRDAMARAGISSVQPTGEDIERAEREVMQGWTMPDALGTSVGEAPGDPLDGGFPATGHDAPPTSAAGGNDDYGIEE